MIYFVLSKDFKVLSKLVCVLLLLSIAVWNLAFSIIQVSKTYETALFWLNVSSSGWCTIAVFALWLSLVLSERDKYFRKWYYITALIVPAFFIYQQWTGNLVDEVVRQPYGWSILWSKTVWPWLFYAYYGCVPVIVLYIGYTTAKRRKYSFEKRRIKLTVSSGYIFFISATVIDVLLPRLNIHVIPPFGSVTALILACAIIYGITKIQIYEHYAGLCSFGYPGDNERLSDPYKPRRQNYRGQ